MSSLDEIYAKLLKQPCTCVSCTCLSGYRWRYDSETGQEESEICEDCDGSGLTEECDRCTELEDVEREREYLCESSTGDSNA